MTDGRDAKKRGRRRPTAELTHHVVQQYGRKGGSARAPKAKSDLWSIVGGLRSEDRGADAEEQVTPADESAFEVTIDVAEPVSVADSSPAGPASPATGPASPATGPASPATGPASPVTGPASPATGPASPATGPASPATGPASPAVGPASPAVGPASAATPATGPAHPVVAEPVVSRPPATGPVSAPSPPPPTAESPTSEAETPEAEASLPEAVAPHTADAKWPPGGSASETYDVRQLSLLLPDGGTLELAVLASGPVEPLTLASSPDNSAAVLALLGRLAAEPPTERLPRADQPAAKPLSNVSTADHAILPAGISLDDAPVDSPAPAAEARELSPGLFNDPPTQRWFTETGDVAGTTTAAAARRGPVRGGAAASLGGDAPIKLPEQARPVRRRSQAAARVRWGGLDLGDGETKLVLSALPGEGEVSIFIEPSMATMLESGEILVGEAARAGYADNASRTLCRLKQLLGRPYDDPRVTAALATLAVPHRPAEDGTVELVLPQRRITIVDLCTRLLAELRRRAADATGTELCHVVLAAPVSFGARRRQALEEAARAAGFTVEATLSSPTANLLAHDERGPGRLALVIDLGVTFDLSLVELCERSFNVLATADEDLGAADLDVALASHLAERHRELLGVELRQDPDTWRQLVFACQEAKRALATAEETEVVLAGQRGGQRLPLSRADVVARAAPLVERLAATAQGLVERVGRPPDVSLITGGLAHLGALREQLAKRLDLDVRAGAQIAVARGAAARAAALGGQRAGPPQQPAGKPEGTGAEGALGVTSTRRVGVAAGGGVSALFDIGDPVPAEARRVFVTERDGQVQLALSVCLYDVDQAGWRVLGKLTYRGLLPREAGEGKVEFTFKLDEHGHLGVKALVEGKVFEKQIPLG